MLKDMTLGRYSPGSSLLHRADPRTKILLTIGFIAAVFLLGSYPSLLVLLLLTLGLAHMAGKTPRQSAGSLKLVLCLAVASVAANLLFVKGIPVAEYGILRHVSVQALDSSARLVLRLSLLATAASLLTFTTTPHALTEGLERLLKPLNRCGIAVSDAALIMLIALRFMPVIVEEAEKLMLAQSSRSPDFNSGSLPRRIKSFVPLLIPLFAGVARRGDAMVTAMEARCYRGSAGRTRIRPLAFSRADLACVAVMLAVFSLPVGLEITRVV